MQDRIPMQRDLPQCLMVQGVLGFGLAEVMHQFLGAQPDFVVPLQHLIGQFIDSLAGAFPRGDVLPDFRFQDRDSGHETVDLGGKRRRGIAQTAFLAGEIGEIFRVNQRQRFLMRGVA